MYCVRKTVIYDLNYQADDLGSRKQGGPTLERYSPLMTTTEQIRLPPGSLGLELEPIDRRRSRGLRVKGWGSNIFSLQCLAPQTEIVSVDGVEVKGIHFKEAVALLRASKTRNITYIKNNVNSPPVHKKEMRS